MRVEQEGKKEVVVVMSADEAQMVLETLLAQGDALGKEGASLAEALGKVGIEPPVRAEHPRTEYMPPKD